MAKKSKKKRRNVSNVMKTELGQTIDKMWAENGLICTIDKKGTENKMDIREAASRARSINAMPIPSELHHLLKHREEFVNKIIETIKLAKQQIDRPKDKLENYVTKLLQNKDEKGNLIVPTEDMTVRNNMFKYFTLSESEVGTVVRNIKDPKEVDKILGAVHAERVSDPKEQEKLLQQYK